MSLRTASIAGNIISTDAVHSSSYPTRAIRSDKPAMRKYIQATIAGILSILISAAGLYVSLSLLLMPFKEENFFWLIGFTLIPAHLIGGFVNERILYPTRPLELIATGAAIGSTTAIILSIATNSTGVFWVYLFLVISIIFIVIIGSIFSSWVRRITA